MLKLYILFNYFNRYFEIMKNSGNIHSLITQLLIVLIVFLSRSAKLSVHPILTEGIAAIGGCAKFGPSEKFFIHHKRAASKELPQLAARA